MDILLLLFCSWAITNVIVNGSILDKFRDYLLIRFNFWGKLFSCMLCMGFWTGLGLHLFLVVSSKTSINIDILLGGNWMDSVIFAFVSSGTCVLLNSFIIYLLKEKNRMLRL